MRRTHNTKYETPDLELQLRENGLWPTEKAALAVLFDIRRELRLLNATQPALDMKLNDVRAELRRVNKRLRGQGMKIRGRKV